MSVTYITDSSSETGTIFPIDVGNTKFDNCAICSTMNYDRLGLDMENSYIPEVISATGTSMVAARQMTRTFEIYSNKFNQHIIV